MSASLPLRLGYPLDNLDSLLEIVKDWDYHE